MKQTIIIFASTILLFSHVVVFSSEQLQIKSSYSAELKSYNKFNPKRIHKSKVVMTPHGVRVESKDMFADNGKGLYIQNFKENKSWVVDPQNKIFSRIEEDKNEEDSTSAVGGIMATRPCLGSESHQKKITGQTALHDDKIIIWSCIMPNKHTIKQGYSQKWNIVVWEQLPNGDISELVGIKAVDYEGTFFMPSKKYREVTLKEFYTGAPSLESYAPEKE